MATHINLGASEDKLDLPYDSALSCGGCVRAGYYYCISRKDKHRGRVQGDFCCDSKECVLEKMAYHDYYCATQFTNETEWVYKDRLVMLQKFCAKRQNNTLCCPQKRHSEFTLRGGDDDDDEEDCEIELKKKEWTNVTLNLTDLPYGGSCTYEVKAKCGYPQLVVNNTNIDMVVAYKKKNWDNDTYKPDDDDEYDDDEREHPHKDKHGKIEYYMPEKCKHDHNDTDCQKTKLYLTLTNLLNPNKPTLTATSRMLQEIDDGDDTIALLQSTAAEEGFTGGNAFAMVFSAFVYTVLILSTLSF